MTEAASKRNVWKIVAILAIAALLGVVVGLILHNNNDNKSSSRARTRASRQGIITFAQGRSTRLRITRAAVVRRLGKPLPVTDKPSCMYYAVSDQRRTVWRFCFRRGKLVTSGTYIR